MAHGYLSASDTRGDSFGTIASAIAERVKRSSDMAARERRFAEAKAEAAGTSLDEAGVGRGFFFKRALGSSFGGDRIARTRGRFSKTPTAGTDPTTNQNARFRGGFDYSYSENPLVSKKKELPLGKKGGPLAIREPGGALAPPISRMVSNTALQKAASPAINPEVRGGAIVRGMGNAGRINSADDVSNRIVNIGATNLGVERDLPGDDMFVKRMEPVGGGVGGEGGTAEIVQAIDRLTFVTMNLVTATKDQTKEQKLIAARQEQTAEKIARDAKADAEEKALEQGGDFSGNTAFEGLSDGKAGEGGGLLGGMLGAAGNIASMVGGRGRGLGKAAQRGGGKGLGKGLKGIGGRLLGRGAGKGLGKGLLKGAGKGLGKGLLKGGLKMGIKKIPVAGLLAGALFAGQRAMAGDWGGAALELASGAASTVPGVGTAASVGIDAALMAKDAMSEAPQASGGAIMSGPKEGYPAMMHGTEMVLSGNKSKETLKIGEALAEGQLRFQKRKPEDYAKLAGKGLQFYFEKMSGFGLLFKGIGGLISLIPGVKGVGNMLKGLTGGVMSFLGLADPNTPGADKLAKGSDPNVRSQGRLTSGTGLTSDPTSKMKAAKGTALRGDYNSFLGGNPAFTSAFGYRDTGLADASKDHPGIDIGVDADSEVKAIQSGKVVQIIQRYGTFGKGVVVEHADGSRNIYGHVDPQVAVGDEVKAGDKIAMIRHWPDPKYPAGRQHLHLERYEGGAIKDPQSYLNNLMAEDQAEVDKDTKTSQQQLENSTNPQVQALNSLLSGKQKSGTATIEGVGTYTKSNPRGARFDHRFKDDKGNTISRDEFMKRLQSAQNDPSSALNKASADVASGDRAAANSGGQQVAVVPTANAGGGKSGTPDAPNPAPGSSDVLPGALRQVQLSTVG